MTVDLHAWLIDYSFFFYFFSLIHYVWYGFIVEIFFLEFVQLLRLSSSVHLELYGG